ncbi:hypothetical protein DFH06DRAFT_1144069 [Mycena polygramma]|nr:hypothetical protein DFH06DRAFT_1144069 [Mycena polygramma]
MPPPPFIPGETPLGPPASFNTAPTVATAMTQANVAQMNNGSSSSISSVATSGVPTSLGSRLDTSPGPPNWTTVTYRRPPAPSSTRSSNRSTSSAPLRRDDGSDWHRPRDSYRPSAHRPRDNVHRVSRDDRVPDRADPSTRHFDPPPDIWAAPIEEGQPLRPTLIGAGSAEVRSRAIPHNPRYEERETERLQQVTLRMDDRSAVLPTRPADPNLVGPWHGVTISTNFHAYNFELWLVSGCPFTWELFKWICRSSSGNPLSRRTEGEDYILTCQSRYLEIHREREAWNHADTGATRRPLADRLSAPSNNPPSGPSVPRPPTASAHAAHAAHAAAGNHPFQCRQTPSIQTNALSQLGIAIGDLVQPPSPRFEGPSYFGLSPPSPEPSEPADPSDPPTTAKANIRQSTRSSRQVLYDHYANRPADAWPLGVRTRDGYLPTTQSAAPDIYDLLALNTLQALAPNAREDRDLNIEFVELAIELLSVPGFFEKLIEHGCYAIDFYPMSQYAYGRDHMDLCHVAAWIVLHGILPSHHDFPHLRSFAQSARRHRDGVQLSGPVGEFTTGYPKGYSDTRELVESDVTPWRHLNFGTVREGLTTTVPARPGQRGDIAGDSEMPPPEEDVDGIVVPANGDDDALFLEGVTVWVTNLGWFSRAIRAPETVPDNKRIRNGFRRPETISIGFRFGRPETIADTEDIRSPDI